MTGFQCCFSGCQTAPDTQLSLTMSCCWLLLFSNLNKLHERDGNGNWNSISTCLAWTCPRMPKDQPTLVPIHGAHPHPWCHTGCNREDREHACSPLTLCTPKRPNASKKTIQKNPNQTQKSKLPITMYVSLFYHQNTSLYIFLLKNISQLN